MSSYAAQTPRRGKADYLGINLRVAWNTFWLRIRRSTFAFPVPVILNVLLNEMCSAGLGSYPGVCMIYHQQSVLT